MKGHEAFKVKTSMAINRETQPNTRTSTFMRSTRSAADLCCDADAVGDAVAIDRPRGCGWVGTEYAVAATG